MTERLRPHRVLELLIVGVASLLTPIVFVLVSALPHPDDSRAEGRDTAGQTAVIPDLDCDRRSRECSGSAVYPA
jgi:hypothetical protein